MLGNIGRKSLLRRYRTVILALLACTVCLSAVPVWGAGTLSGQFMLRDNLPMGGALVFFYNLDYGPPPSLDMYWRVPDVVRELDEFGRFKFELQPGTYAVGALKRKGVQELGPVLEGDIFLLSLDENGLLRNYKIGRAHV